MVNYLNKQVYIHSLDTSSFYNDNEYKIHKKLLRSYKYRDYLKKRKNICDKHNRFINDRIHNLKSKLYKIFNESSGFRELRPESVVDSKLISIFDSVLTRTLNIKENTKSYDVMVIQAYYFQVLEDIIKNGFTYNGEKYIYLTSSAGQIRTKKSVFIKEDIFDKHKDTFTCGLSVESINSQGGINTNKYQAYLALSNSATEEWKEFDINKSIVVNDMETDVFCEVDYIDPNTYEITRKEMNIPIEHTDGCGMLLPSVSDKSFMVRLPWIKGLLVPFPFDKFAKENNSYIVTDIYGKQWDIIKDDIRVIFTKSQFKMWKYYKDWNEYKEKFVLYKCQAAKLNEEDTSGEAKLNYQMIQSLTDITNKELETICADTVKDIFSIGSDKETMLRILAATESNKRKNYFQEALYIYPELLNDEYSKQVIKDKKKSLVKDAKSGKLNVNGKYTFLCPDLYAFCERVFLNKENPIGLLNNNEVYCRIFKEGKVDLLRSPHLYREHAVRLNTFDSEKSKWFITDGIYTSIFDPISKILQFDNDGDKSLVIEDELFVNIAERNMKGIVPLYYEMAKASPHEITYDEIYKSLILAYKANIGEISNNITKIWNSDTPNLEVIRWLTMENNFTIDFAKTLYMPTRPESVNKEIHKSIKTKVPHFFIHAKNKELERVEPLNNSVVNRLEKIIPNKRINFTKVAGTFDYEMLMDRTNIRLNDEIINTYKKLDKEKRWKQNSREIDNSTDTPYSFKYIREQLLKVNNEESYVVDVLVKYLYESKNSKHKTTLWSSFGHVLLRNLRKNLKNVIRCEICEEPIKIRSNRMKYCEPCKIKKEKEDNKRYARESMRRKREDLKNVKGLDGHKKA